jgi:hypothetical protein
MDDGIETPAKRVRLERIRDIESGGISPVHKEIRNQDLKDSLQIFSLKHECQLEYLPSSLPPQTGEGPNHLQNELSETIQTSAEYSLIC